MKKVIRLTENDLHRIVKESVNMIIKEARVSKRDKVEFNGLNTVERILKKIEYGKYDDNLLYYRRPIKGLLRNYQTLPPEGLEAIKNALIKRKQWLNNLSPEEKESMDQAASFLERIKDGYFDRTIAEDGEAFIQKANQDYPGHPEIESYIRYKIPGLKKRLENGGTVRNVAGIRYVNDNVYSNPFHPSMRKEVRYEGDPEFPEFEPDKY